MHRSRELYNFYNGLNAIFSPTIWAHRPVSDKENRQYNCGQGFQ